MDTPSIVDRVVSTRQQHAACKAARAAYPLEWIPTDTTGDSHRARWTLQYALLVALEQVTNRARVAAMRDCLLARRAGDVSDADWQRVLGA